MANVVGSACVYNSCDQSSAPVLLLLCSSPPPSVCTYCSLPGKGALKASTSERMAGPMWFCGNTRSKSVNQNFDKITLNFSLSSTLLPSLLPPSLSPWSPHVAQAALEFSVSYTGHKLVIFLSHPPKVLGLQVCAAIPGSHFKSYSKLLIGKKELVTKDPREGWGTGQILSE